MSGKFGVCSNMDNFGTAWSHQQQETLITQLEFLHLYNLGSKLLAATYYFTLEVFLVKHVCIASIP